MNTVTPEQVRSSAIQKCLEHNFIESFYDYKKLIFEYEYISPAILSEAGYVCWKLELYDEAQESFRRALELDPIHRESLLNLVDLKLSLGAHDELDELLEHLLANYSHEPESQILKAKSLILRGEANAGLEMMSRIAEKYNSSITAQWLICKFLLENNYIDHALIISKRSIETGFKHPDLFTFYAESLLKVGDLDSAEVVFKKMDEVYPRRVASYLGLADIYVARKEYNRAEQKLRELLEFAPEQLNATQKLLMILGFENKWDDVLEITTPYIEKNFQLEWLLLFHLSGLANLKKDESIKKFFSQYPDFKIRTRTRGY